MQDFKSELHSSDGYLLRCNTLSPDFISVHQWYTDKKRHQSYEVVAKWGAARHAVHSIPFYKKYRDFYILVSFARALLLKSIVCIMNIFLGSFLTQIENPIT